MNAQRGNMHIVRMALLLCLLSTFLPGCDFVTGPYLHFDTVNPISSTTGQLITVTVSVNGRLNRGPGTGTVSISADTLDPQANTTCTATLVNGRGSCQVAFFSGGNQSITADYSGDAVYGSERATYPYFVVAPLTPTPSVLTNVYLTSGLPNPSNPGESIEFKVEVSSPQGKPSAGTVTISSAGTGAMMCTAMISNGVGSCSAAQMEPGELQYDLDYSGSGAWAGSQNSFMHTANYETQVTLSISPNPPVAGQPVVVTISVSRVTGGAVTTGTVSATTGSVSAAGDQHGFGSASDSISFEFVFPKAGEQTLVVRYTPQYKEGEFEFNRPSETSMQVNVQQAAVIEPWNEPPADTGGGGGTGCMVTNLTLGTYSCVIPCPDPNNYPEVCP